MRAVMHFDGGCKVQNPGVAGCAAIIKLDNGECLKVSRYIGWRTNNFAEYSGLLIGLKVAIDHGVTNIDIFTDSKLVEGQIAKNWRINEPTLRPFVTEIQKLLRVNFGEDNWTIQWVKRNKNTEADALCSQAIQYGRMNNPFTPAHKRQMGKEVSPFRRSR
jgi:ribonuclease HI